MKIAIANDHRGVNIKKMITDMLHYWGHEVTNFGTDDDEPVDYPDYAAAVARSVANGQAERGILICGTGVGMCIVANKYAGVRAVVVSNEGLAKVSREHNDTNVLCLSANTYQIDKVVSVWLLGEFEGGRHAERIEKIKQIEDSCRAN